MLADSLWILLGALAGTTVCLALTPQPVELANASPIAIASFTVFAMLLCSRGDSRLPPVLNR